MLCLHSFGLDVPRSGDDLVVAHDERLRFALRSRDLGVHEHVLDLLGASRQAIAGTPCAYLKALLVRGDAPMAPAHLALERQRSALEPDLVVFADGGPPSAEIEPGRAFRRLEEPHELRWG